MHTAPLRTATSALVALAAAALFAGCSGPSTPESSRPKIAEEWFRRAQREYKAADFDESHDSVQKALAIVAEDPEVRLLAGELALTSLDYAEVLRILKGIPGTEAARLRGRALWYKGDLELAADELEAMLNDPEVQDPWAKSIVKLARNGAGRNPFELKGNMVGAVEMVHVSPVAPYFVVPVEIEGVAALAMITTGSGEVVVDSATHPEPSWVSLRFDHFEVHDVPALAQDLSGISKELNAPIKAMLGVNLLRHLNATFDFSGHQFVVRNFAPPPPPSATRLDLHYARGGGMIVRSGFGGDQGGKGPFAALMVDTSRPFNVALDAEGWKKAGVDVATLKPIPGDPEQKLREGTIPLMHLGAFDLPRIGALSGIPLADLQRATAVDLDGLIGAGLLYPYRCTFADGGRVLWVEDDSAFQANLTGALSARPAPTAAPPSLPSLGLPAPAPLGPTPRPLNQREPSPGNPPPSNPPPALPRN